MPSPEPKTPKAYPPPRKQVLLLTCMDIRLLDDTVEFMNENNLQNRYDHLIYAGAAMGVRLGQTNGCNWKDVFFHHMVAAIDLLHRDIKDVYIIEHLDCGAYKVLPEYPRGAEYAALAEASQFEKLVPLHRKEARLMAREIREFCDNHLAEASQELKEKLEKAKNEEERCKLRCEYEKKEKAWQGIEVRTFVMDLKGHVTRL